MFLADIGQNIVEKLTLVTAGANLGWNDWEGSFRFISRSGVSLANQRGDPAVTYPVAEYGQLDPLLQSQSAAAGLQVYRDDAIPQLSNLVLFADQPSGEIFYIQADDLPSGGQDAIRRILLNDAGEAKTLLQLIQGKKRRPRQVARLTLGPAFRPRTRWSGFPAQQVRRHRSAPRSRWGRVAVSRKAVEVVERLATAFYGIGGDRGDTSSYR